MRFRDRIKFYKQRRICKKIQYCIEMITRLEPTVDGSFYSPNQLRALRQLHLLCEEIGCLKSAFITNSPYLYFDNTFFHSQKDEEEWLKLRKLLRHSAGENISPVFVPYMGPRFHTEDFPRYFDNVDNEDYRKLGLEALVKSRRISAEFHNPEGVVFRDVQRPEGFKEDKPDEV